ncbi:MAG: MBL fold metallo-hydrolase [Isosphaeraceae bacterium]|nr:MBL fold metallo-hydrolase [Isosphaeraceae bacterium]
MPGSDYEIEPVESAPFGQIAYVAWWPDRDDALVVDPGFDTDTILEILARHGRRVAAILNTHGHADHIAGNATIKHAFPDAPIVIGRNEAYLLTDAEANLSAPFGLPFTSPPADRLVSDGERLEVAGFSFEVREIPGHSPGSVVFVALGVEAPFVFGGDVLFSGSVGRADKPGDDPHALFEGIRAKLFNLPDATLVLPGHGPATTVGQERRTNPFVGERVEPYRPGMW